jgi:hypothetical protein
MTVNVDLKSRAWAWKGCPPDWLALFPLCFFQLFLLFDQRKLELGVRGSIPQMAFAAFRTSPVEECGHVGIVVNQNIVVLIDEALELTILVVTFKFQK